MNKIIYERDLSNFLFLFEWECQVILLSKWDPEEIKTLIFMLPTFFYWKRDYT